MPDGGRYTRKFHKVNTLGDVMNFIKRERKQEKIDTVQFLTSFPKKYLKDGNLTLEAAGISKREVLTVKINRDEEMEEAQNTLPE